MMSKAKGPTKAEKKRFDAFRDIGCVCCRQDGRKSEYVANHLLDGGRRIGHGATIPECPWHADGIPPDGMSVKACIIAFGPSRKTDKAGFHARYGTDSELLAYTNTLLAQCGITGDQG